MLLRLAAATAAAALLAGAASAQPATAPAPAAAPESAAPAPAPSADASAAPSTSADTSGYNARSSTDAVPAVADLGSAKAGDPGIVSNGPVPDTPENRAKYGKPDSHAGKRTQPAGN